MRDGQPVVAWTRLHVRSRAADYLGPGDRVFPAQPDLSQVLISLKRTQCYGTCPSYRVQIRGNGEVLYRGEEFVLVLYGPPDDYARTLPEQLRQDIMALAIQHEGSRVAPTISVSIGVAIADANSGRSLTGAIQAADEALYEAKQCGRNRVIFKDASESEVETGNFRAAYRQVS